MPKEYIEREALIEELNKAPAYFGSGDVQYGILLSKDIVEKQPIADVVEVVRCKDCERGEWIKHKPDPKLMDEFHKLGIGRGMSRDSIFWYCSCCDGWGTPNYKFCPNCGADMRKEDNNERQYGSIQS